MSIVHSSLKTEINSDPAGLGYAPFISSGNYGGAAAILNTIRSGVAADGKNYSIHRDDVLPAEVIDAISATDFAALTTLQSQQLQLLLGMRSIDCTRNNLRTNLVNIFPVGGGSHAPINNLTSRNGSRAEVLFGIRTIVEASDIAQALAS